MGWRPSSVRRAAALAATAGWVTACAADPGDPPKAAAGSGAGDDGGATLDSGGADASVSFETGGDDTGGPPASDASPLPDATADALPVADSSASGTDAAALGDNSASDSAGTETSLDGSSCAQCPLVVQYMTTTTAAMTQEIRPHVDIFNNGATAQDLGSLTLRYWFTADGSTSQAFDCDYATIGCGLMQAAFVGLSTPTPSADSYLEVSFTGGSVAAGSHTGEIQLRFHDSAYAATFTQTNDYSFDPAHVAYAPWDRITLYRGGTLIWGTEP
jgi:cellulose 1,4-beta-cellobiosidase